jgi:hypothetical protein
MLIMGTKTIKSSLVLFLLLLTVWNASAQTDQDLVFRKRVFSSAINGLYYGGALIAIVEPQSGAAAAGIPIITTGLGVLTPILLNEKYPINMNQAILTQHGQFIGWGHGASLSILALGDNISNENNYKIAIGTGALGSIGMGLLGRSLGKNQPWSEGQAANLSLWGTVGPLTTTCLALSFSSDARVISGSFLLGGAAGYLLGNAFNQSDSYTRGDIRATGALATLNGALGTCIFADIIGGGDTEPGDWGWLFPAAGVLSGTLLGQAWMKGTDLTPRQGMNAIWMASGGAVLGLGIALIVNSDSFTPWYAIPYATSLGAFAYSVESARKKNAAVGSASAGNWNKWSFSFMPQNLFLNEKIMQNGYRINGNKVLMQPLFSASFSF